MSAPGAPGELAGLRGRLKELEETQRAMLNLLEDVDAERMEFLKAQGALLNILEDIEQERAKVDQARTLLQAVNAELEAFSYSVSHDLRSPLRAISGFSEAVEADYAPRLDDEGKRYLRLIQENAHRMGNLIDDLLEFSRLGRRSMASTEIDMNLLAGSVFSELAASEPGRKLEFRSSPVPSAVGDSSMLRQVFANLFANAIKFTRKREVAVVEFGFTPQPGGGAYYVRDNGVGFDMKYVDKLFGVFQRLHSLVEFEGTGVGLALVQRVITRHGGKVWAEGAENQGATFHFTVPGRNANDQRGV